MGRKDQLHNIYKDHFACFVCRKTFKQPNVLDLPKAKRPRKGEERVILCPQCGQPMHEMGNAFKAPRQGAVKQWRKVELLFQKGIKFDYYGWSGPGYRPETMREVEPYLDRTLLKTKETDTGKTMTSRRRGKRER